MKTYIMLMTVSEKGVRSIKKAPERIEENIRALEKAGGRMIGIYSTMGQYDFVAVVEAPDDDVMFKHVLDVSASSALKCVTLKAIPKDDFFKIVKSLS